MGLLTNVISASIGSFTQLTVTLSFCRHSGRDCGGVRRSAVVGCRAVYVERGTRFLLFGRSFERRRIVNALYP